MAVINVTVLESSLQVISGIPKTITISTNIPATIFYTLDGSDPTVTSSVYGSTLTLPTNLNSFTFKIFATNGTDNSAIISNNYGPDMTHDRLPHSAVINLNNTSGSLGPFGSNSPGPTFNYTNTSKAGITVDAPGLIQIPSGLFDGYGNSASSTNLPLSNYTQIYSTRDKEGQNGRGVGNLPGSVKFKAAKDTQEESNKSDKLFNPKALVIFQDQSLENPADPAQINREFFALENAETVKDGALLFNSGIDSPTVTGSFLRSHHNPKDNTITYYYYDNSVCRWLISKQPCQQKDSVMGNLSGMVFGRAKTNGMVFAWQPFARRVLY